MPWRKKDLVTTLRRTTFFSFFSLYVLCFCQPHLVPQKREKYNLFFKHKTKRMQEQTAVGTEMFITKHLFKLNELLA